jgi:hypothetical protein
MGQVMQRLRLDWLGRQATEVQAKNTFKVCVILVVAYTVYSYFIDYLAPDFVYGNVEERPLWLGILSYLGAIIMTVWGVVALTNTRSFVCHKYAIPEDQRCLGLEDVCCDDAAIFLSDASNITDEDKDENTDPRDPCAEKEAEDEKIRILNLCGEAEKIMRTRKERSRATGSNDSHEQNITSELIDNVNQKKLTDIGDPN